MVRLTGSWSRNSRATITDTVIYITRTPYWHNRPESIHGPTETFLQSQHLQFLRFGKRRQFPIQGRCFALRPGRRGNLPGFPIETGKVQIQEQFLQKAPRSEPIGVPTELLAHFRVQADVLERAGMLLLQLQQLGSALFAPHGVCHPLDVPQDAGPGTIDLVAKRALRRVEELAPAAGTDAGRWVNPPAATLQTILPDVSRAGAVNGVRP